LKFFVWTSDDFRLRQIYRHANPEPIIRLVRQCRFRRSDALLEGLQMKPRPAIKQFDRSATNRFEVKNKIRYSRHTKHDFRPLDVFVESRLSDVVNENPSTLAVNQGVRLASNRSQCPNRGDYTAQANEHQKEGEYSDSYCRTERPSLDVIFTLYPLLVLGGFLWSAGAIVCLYFDYERRFVRTLLILASIFGVVCAEGGVLFFIMTGFYPYTWGLPPQWIPAKWNPCPPNYRQYFPHRETVSQKVLTSTNFPYYNKYMANVLSTDKQTAIIGALCEGSSIRSIERITGVHRDTIMRLGVRVGQGCMALLDAKMRNLPCTRLEMDEIWGFVGKKERHMRPGDDPTFGNVWTFCAIDADTKLVPAFRVAGDRGVETATAFVLDVADRMKNRLQISTDGLSAYVDAIDWAFGGNVDYGQIIKTYGTEESVEAQRRYSAPKISSIEKKAICGRPDFDLISTSYVERLNATTRLHMKRLARLTYAFSKKRENFEAAVGLHFAYYNLVKRHITLRCTPAMAAGVEKSFWTVDELVGAAMAA
jgi:IS1 family transposase